MSCGQTTQRLAQKLSQLTVLTAAAATKAAFVALIKMKLPTNEQQQRDTRELRCCYCHRIVAAAAAAAVTDKQTRVDQ